MIKSDYIDKNKIDATYSNRLHLGLIRRQVFIALKAETLVSMRETHSNTATYFTENFDENDELSRLKRKHSVEQMSDKKRPVRNHSPKKTTQI